MVLTRAYFSKGCNTSVAVLEDYNQPPAGHWAFEDGCQNVGAGRGKCVRGFQPGCGRHASIHRLRLWSGVGDMPAPTCSGSSLVWVTCQLPHAGSGLV